MGRHAGKVKQNLSDLATIDQTAIDVIVNQLPPSTVELTTEQINSIASKIDVSTKVDKRTGYSLVDDREIAKIHESGSDNQDLSGLQPKETGKGLYPDADALKLAGIESEANKYVHPDTHAPSIIEQDASNRFVTDAEKSTWNTALTQQQILRMI